MKVKAKAEKKTANSAIELMELHDREFVDCAYWTLLGRAADLDGLAHYRGHLRRGTPKAQLLWHLARSGEGQAHGASLPGLKAVFRLYRRARLPLFGWFFVLVGQAEGTSRAARRRRALENSIWAVEQDLNRRFDRIEARMEELMAAGPASARHGNDLPLADQPFTRRAHALFDALSDIMPTVSPEN